MVVTNAAEGIFERYRKPRNLPKPKQTTERRILAAYAVSQLQGPDARKAEQILDALRVEDTLDALVEGLRTEARPQVVEIAAKKGPNPQLLAGLADRLDEPELEEGISAIYRRIGPHNNVENALRAVLDDETKVPPALRIMNQVNPDWVDPDGHDLEKQLWLTRYEQANDRGEFIFEGSGIRETQAKTARLLVNCLADPTYADRATRIIEDQITRHTFEHAYELRAVLKETLTGEPVSAQNIVDLFKTLPTNQATAYFVILNFDTDQIHDLVTDCPEYLLAANPTKQSARKANEFLAHDNPVLQEQGKRMLLAYDERLPSKGIKILKGALTSEDLGLQTRARQVFEALTPTQYVVRSLRTVLGTEFADTAKEILRGYGMEAVPYLLTKLHERPSREQTEARALHNELVAEGIEPGSEMHRNLSRYDRAARTGEPIFQEGNIAGSQGVAQQLVNYLASDQYRETVTELIEDQVTRGHFRSARELHRALRYALREYDGELDLAGEVVNLFANLTANADTANFVMEHFSWDQIRTLLHPSMGKRPGYLNASTAVPKSETTAVYMLKDSELRETGVRLLLETYGGRASERAINELGHILQSPAQVEREAAQRVFEGLQLRQPRQTVTELRSLLTSDIAGPHARAILTTYGNATTHHLLTGHFKNGLPEETAAKELYTELTGRPVPVPASVPVNARLTA